MCWDPAFKSPNFQLRRGISQNNATSAASILYWYFFSDHNRRTLPLLLISICNIGNNIAKRYNLLVLLSKKLNILLKCIPDHITISQKEILEWQTDKRVNGSHYLLDFHLCFYLYFENNSVHNVHNFRNCMLPYIFYSNDVCKICKELQCKSRLL